MAAAWVSLPGGFDVSQPTRRRSRSRTSVRICSSSAPTASGAVVSRVMCAPGFEKKGVVQLAGARLGHEPAHEAAEPVAAGDVALPVGAVARDQRAGMV